MACRPKRIAPSVGLILAVALGTTSLARAQQGLDLIGPAPQQAPQGLNPDSFYGKEPNDGVYVRDSAAAVEKFMLARKMERLKEWNKSADLYQEVINKYSDRVIPSQIDQDKKIYQYTSIINLVQEQLGKWPREGLDVYRARYETPASAELQKAGPEDAGTLNRVYSTYFITDAGKQAGMRLIDLYMEAGEFPAAAWIGDRLLTLHPNLQGDRPGILYRTALAYYFAGDSDKAAERLKTLHDKFPNERGTIRGKDTILSDSLAQDIQHPRAQTLGALSDSWPMVGGDPSRGRVSPANGKPGARLYGVPLPRAASIAANSASGRSLMESEEKDNADKGLYLGVMPSVDRGELYFQDGQHLFALSLDSGVPLPGWAQSYPDGVFTLPGVIGPARGQQLSVTLAEHDVLAIMGLPDHMLTLRGIQPGETRLVCLDRATGKQRWSVALNSAPGLSEIERSLHMAGSPLVVGDNVLVFGSASKQAGFEDSYVLCFDLNTGKHRWSTYVASANTPNFMYGMQMPPLSDNTSHLAYANGRVYAQTNLGAVAALDAYTGSIDWLDVYPTEHPVEFRGRGRFWAMQNNNSTTRNQRKPWAYNPVIVQDGYVFALPTDSKNVLVYDAGDGHEIKRISLPGIEERWQTDHGSDRDALDGLDTLVGVSGDRLYISGEHSIVCLRWKDYDRDKFSFQGDQWVEWFPSNINFRGRPFLTRNTIFAATEDRLYMVNTLKGKLESAFPHEPARWEDPEGPGNVVVTNDHVILAGSNMVNVYTDLAVARARLEREIAAAPSDPQPHLRFAEVMLAAGESDSAIAKMDEAIRLLGGRTTMQAGPARDRIFTDALTFAQKLAARNQPETLATAVKLFDRAADAAFTPTQQVNYRLVRAKYLETHRHQDQAVALYQQILSDSKMRAVPMVDSLSGAPTQAASIAENAIAALIRLKPGVYASIQQQATDAFRAATENKEGSASRLMAVAQTYPNSSVAPQAMLAAADAYESEANPREAIQVLRQMWFKYPESPDRARILEAMARNYFAIPNHSEAAAAALARASALPVEPRLLRDLKLPDGKVIEKETPVDAALAAVRKFRGQEAARSLPDFRIPLVTSAQILARHIPPAFVPAGENTTIENIRALLLPLREAARPDRVVAWSKDGNLLVFAAGQTTPKFTISTIKEEPANSAWVGDTLLVWGKSQISGIDAGADGQEKVRWTVSLNGMPSIEVAKLGTGEAEPAGSRDIVVINGRVMLQGDRRVARQFMRGMPLQVINNGNGGMVQVVARPAANASEQIVEVRPVSAERVLLTTTFGRILAADLSNGHIAWQVRLTDRPVDRLIANEDFTVVKVSDDSAVRLAALDTATGQLRCHKSFGLQSGNVPINMALAVDGTLVYTLADKLCLKDLYKPWPDPSDREAVSPAGQSAYAGATDPDQLLIAEGRILALADSGTERDKFVNIYSLETGQIVSLPYKAPNGDRETERRLTAGKSWNTRLRLVGPHLYIVTAGQVLAYNLDHPAETWATLPNMLPLADVKEVAVGRQHLAVLDEDQTDETLPRGGNDAPAGAVPGGGAAAGQPQVQPNPTTVEHTGPAKSFHLYLFRRTPISATNPAESGRLDYSVPVTDPAGILPAWQPVEGGFCYLTADGKLHLLRGASQ